MNINRNNYEEFFLLYVDGELSQQERVFVEEFLQQNSDLQEEFNFLAETKLPLENEMVFDKSGLYKNEAAFISSTNCEEQFLLYVDNELNHSQKAEVEKFVLQHPDKQQDFINLKNTVLPKEEVICPNKESLYKENRKPVVMIWVRRMSVAAAVLLFGFLAWQLKPTSNKVDEATTAKNTNQPTKKDEPKATEQLPTNSDNKIISPKTEQVVIVKNKENFKTNTSLPIVQKATVTNNTTVTNNSVAASNTTANNNGTVAQKQDVLVTNNTSTVAAQNNTITNATNSATNAVAVNNKNNFENSVTKSQPTTYTILNTDEERPEVKNVANDNNVVYIGSLEVSKTKITSLFKKAKKAFAKSKESDNAGLITL